MSQAVRTSGLAPRLARSLLGCALMVTAPLGCGGGCGGSSAGGQPCTFDADCAEPYEYCSAQTSRCTPHECLDDQDCSRLERCDLQLNLCEAFDCLVDGDCPGRQRCEVKLNVCVEPPPRDMGWRDMSPPPRDMSPAARDLDDFDASEKDQDAIPDLLDLADGVEEMDTRPDVTPPEITSIWPPAGSALNAPSGDPISLEVSFSEPLDPSSVGPMTIALRDDQDRLIEADISYDAARSVVTLTVTAAEGLAGSRLYHLEIDQAIRDLSLNHLAEERRALYYPAFTEDPALHALAERYAPIIHQELATLSALAWRHDLPTRLDFDGDWSAANNLEQVDQIAPGDYRAAVYYQVTQSASHTFIVYTLYYPSRTLTDAQTLQTKRFEHDFTGAVFVIERQSEELLLIEGLRVEPGSDVLLAFLNQDKQVELSGAGRIKADFDPAQLVGGERFRLYVPASRHETCDWYEPHINPPYDLCQHPAEAFRAGFKGIILSPGVQGQGLEHATQSAPGEPYEATYALLPFEETFWMRRDLIGRSGLFERDQLYSPDEMRPAGPASFGGAALHLPQQLSSDDLRSYGDTPFMWLTQPARQNGGQWLIDPAWTLPRRYTLPDEPPWSQLYCYNALLEIDTRQSAACAVSTAPEDP